MTTAVQLQLRRDTQANVIGMTPTQGEAIVDDTNNRACIGDGSTAGGWPALKLSEHPGGMLNRFRNGAMDIFQRGTGSIAVTTAGAYTADGWIVVPTGASVAVQQAVGRSLTVNSLQITGAVSVTDLIIKQRIESYLAAPLTSQVVTVQAQIFNNTAGTITPTLTVKHANAADNWGATTTDVNAVNLQSCGNGAWTRVAYTFTDAGSAANGLEISFDFGNNFSHGTQTLKITELDIRATPGCPTGVAANATYLPPPELRPIASELALCQRYFQFLGGTGTSWVIGGGVFSSATNGYCAVFFPVTMRAPPTLTASAANAATFVSSANFTTSAIAFVDQNPGSAALQGTVAGATAGQGALVVLITPASITVSAEL